jgi:hypothetical protein
MKTAAAADSQYERPETRKRRVVSGLGQHGDEGRVEKLPVERLPRRIEYSPSRASGSAAQQMSAAT